MPNLAPPAVEVGEMRIQESSYGVWVGWVSGGFGLEPCDAQWARDAAARFLEAAAILDGQAAEIAGRERLKAAEVAA